MSSLKDQAPLIGIIANSTSMTNRADLIAELGDPHDGFFNPLRFSFKKLRGEIVALDIQPNEVLEKSGMIKARQAMLAALDYLYRQGAKVVCFTASTKRLPGKSGYLVKKLYPDLIFSIGDSATMISYLSLLDHHLNGSGLINSETDQLACLGAGFLGLKSIEHLLSSGAKNISLVSEQKIDNLPDSVRVVRSIKDLPSNIKLFMSCSHKYTLDAQLLGQKLAPEAVILDVAVPPGISRELFASLPSGISRFDAGDFFLPDIRQEFPAQILSFPQVGFWYGCFTEAVILSIALSKGEDLRPFDFFSVNQENCDLIRAYLSKEDVSVPLINFYQAENIKFIDF